MKITVTANDEWRYRRIDKTLRLVGKILNLTTEQLELLIVELVDEKGLLYVKWATPPTRHQIEAVLSAWEESEKYGQICTYPNDMIYGGPI